MSLQDEKARHLELPAKTGSLHASYPIRISLEQQAWYKVEEKASRHHRRLRCVFVPNHSSSFSNSPLSHGNSSSVRFVSQLTNSDSASSLALMSSGVNSSMCL